MKRILLLASVLMLLITAFTFALAQDETEPVELVNSETAPGIELLYPVSVSELWGNAHFVGTANVAGMSYYFLEAMHLNTDLSVPPNAAWLPITAGLTTPVNQDVLAVIDTTDIDDGVYAFRLVISTEEGQTYNATVGPVRISNDLNTALADFVTTNDGAFDFDVDSRENVVVTREAPTEPEPTEEPDQPVDNSPRVISENENVSPNVRYCDIVDNDMCPVVTRLDSRAEAPILARSSNATGWFQIRSSDGVVGWISPTVVDTLGDISGVPFVAPPTPLPKPTPAPTNSPANVAFPNGIEVVGGVSACGENFNVRVNITNQGNTVTNQGVVTLQAISVVSGAVTYSNVGNYPALSPNTNYVVTMPVLINTYPDSVHKLRAYTNNREFTLDIYLRPTDKCQ